MERDFARPNYEPEPIDEKPRPKQSWKRAILILVLVFAGGPLVVFGPQLLLRQSSAGTVTFGTSVSGCTLGGRSSTFPKGSTIYGVVLLDRGVSPGEVVTVRLLRGDTEVSTTSFAVISTGSCESEPFDDGLLPAGQYRVTYSAEGELLAQGTFDVS